MRTFPLERGEGRLTSGKFFVAVTSKCQNNKSVTMFRKRKNRKNKKWKFWTKNDTKNKYHFWKKWQKSTILKKINGKKHFNYSFVCVFLPSKVKVKVLEILFDAKDFKELVKWWSLRSTYTKYLQNMPKWNKCVKFLAQKWQKQKKCHF